MECEDKLWRLVAFFSKSLNKTERNYKIHDKEILAIIRGLEAWRHLLKDAHFKFKIWTDCYGYSDTNNFYFILFYFF